MAAFKIRFSVFCVIRVMTISRIPGEGVFWSFLHTQARSNIVCVCGGGGVKILNRCFFGFSEKNEYYFG